jgi:hypothetical protein
MGSNLEQLPVQVLNMPHPLTEGVGGKKVVWYYTLLMHAKPQMGV